MNQTNNTLTTTQSIVVKLRYQDQIRRFSLLKENLTWTNVEAKIREILQLPSTSGISVKYEDDEKDLIHLDSNAELLHAIELSHSRNLLSLIVTDKPTSSSTEKTLTEDQAPISLQKQWGARFVPDLEEHLSKLEDLGCPHRHLNKRILIRLYKTNGKIDLSHAAEIIKKKSAKWQENKENHWGKRGNGRRHPHAHASSGTETSDVDHNKWQECKGRKQNKWGKKWHKRHSHGFSENESSDADNKCPIIPDLEEHLIKLEELGYPHRYLNKHVIYRVYKTNNNQVDFDKVVEILKEKRERFQNRKGRKECRGNKMGGRRRRRGCGVSEDSLNKLEEMGYTDRCLNRRALKKYGGPDGDVNIVVEFLEARNKIKALNEVAKEKKQEYKLAKIAAKQQKVELKLKRLRTRREMRAKKNEDKIQKDSVVKNETL